MTRPGLLPTLSVVSVACGVLVLVAWTASYRVGTVVDWTRLAADGGRSLRAVVEQGGIGVAWSTETDSEQVSRYVPGISCKTFEPTHRAFLLYPESVANRMGFGYDRVVNVAGGTYSETAIAFPLWLPVLLTLFPPALWLRRWRKQQRAKGFPVEVNANA